MKYKWILIILAILIFLGIIGFLLFKYIPETQTIVQGVSAVPGSPAGGIAS